MRKGDPVLWTLLLCAALAGSARAADAEGESEPTTAAGIRARAAQADADPAVQARLLQLGRQAAIVCAHCHGAHGSPARPEIPILTAQKRAYLLEQLQQFADGRRRDPLMEVVLRNMSLDEMVGAVLFFSSQPLRRPAGPPPAFSADAGSAGRPPESGTSTAAAP
jgi:cytochrome c553